MKYCKTKKLFYNKYSCKVVCELYGAWRISRLGFLNAKKWARDPNLMDEPVWYSVIDKHNSIKENKKSLHQFMCLFEKYVTTEDIYYTSSYNRFIIYLNDENLATDLEETLGKYVTEIWRPTNTNVQNYLENNVNVVVCKRLPYAHFEFKVYLKYNIPLSIKESLYNWYLNSVKIDNVKMTNSLQQYISGNKRYMSTNYFYVRNQGDILLVTMLLDKFISKIEKYETEKNIKELNILSIKDNINAGT